MERDEKIDNLLAKVDTGKRDFLKKLAIGGVFAIPVVLSFGMDGVKLHAIAVKSGPVPISPNQ